MCAAAASRQNKHSTGKAHLVEEERKARARNVEEDVDSCFYFNSPWKHLLTSIIILDFPFSVFIFLDILLFCFPAFLSLYFVDQKKAESRLEVVKRKEEEKERKAVDDEVKKWSMSRQPSSKSVV